MLKALMLGLTLLISTPFMAHATEITLLPSIKLQIGEKDSRGYYWNGGKWLTSSDWHDHYRWQKNGWHRYNKSWERSKEKARDSYIRGYRDGFKDRKHNKERRHHHRH